MKQNSKKQAIRWTHFGVTFLLFLSGTLPGITSAQAQPHDPLNGVSLPNTEIVSAEIIAAGAFVAPPGTTSPPENEEFKKLSAFRRVVGVARPVKGSNIKFEVWLPVEGWNGKLLAIGNAGFAGNISYGSMPIPLARGYAVASTDTGHHAPANGIDQSWAVGNTESVIDFGYRAIHEMTVKAKAIVAANYGKPPKLSYFVGCSTGGRQALMEAQRYPEDYDGIIAGAPANDWINLMAHGAYISNAMLANPASNIPAVKMKAIEAAAVTACDLKDGLKDGQIEDPTQCKFDPTVLRCTGADGDNCLTEPQVQTLTKLYVGLREKSGIPSLMPGGETGPPGWEMWVPGMNIFAGQFFKNLVFEDPKWEMKTLDLERDTKVAEQKLRSVMDATSPDLSAFRKRGGKLIMYHGWNDAAIPPEMSVNYYKSVVGKFGQRQTDGFVKLYMVPGMGHCALGRGPNFFGQIFGCVSCEAKKDIVISLEQWVENGVSPQEIIAVKYKDDNLRTDVSRTRPLCPFPNVARYKGSGNIDEAANFVCRSAK